MNSNHRLAGLAALMAALTTGTFNAMAEVPRPGHPRPDLLRENWMTLNGDIGLRKITIDGRRILINGKPVFQRLILDQGFYPEVLWTAPSDAALKKDIEMSMACGYIGARLHQKVFEPRFFYWADKLGYLVWGEYPNAGYGNQRQGFSAVVNEWTEILLRDRNHPAIVGWCAFNENFEGSGELQQMIWHITKAVDPTRPALEASGWMHTLPNPEVRDAHDYTGEPESLRKRWLSYFSAPPEGPYPPARYYNPSSSQADRGVPFMLSEIGGIGWATEGGWSYGNGPKTLEEFYARYKGTIDAYVTEKPAAGWLQEGFDDQAWKTGLAPFGNGNGTRTDWKTPEIYFRKTFAYDGGHLNNGAVVIRHNDNTEVYINGQKILGATGSKGYYLCLVTGQLKDALRQGANTIAVHSHEGGRGQWIDLAILVD